MQNSTLIHQKNELAKEQIVNNKNTSCNNIKKPKAISKHE